MNNMTITPMTETHIDSLMTIESSSFKHPWAKSSFLNDLLNQHANNYVLSSQNDTEGIIAYICLREILDEIHLLKIAVNPDYRRKGIAYQFLNRCLNEISKKHFRTVFLEVRPSNAAALNLYRKTGFHVIGKRPKYYTDTGEDAIIMRKFL
jgi:ribosomal-protein-alanine N-acetyltransferase